MFYKGPHLHRTGTRNPLCRWKENSLELVKQGIKSYIESSFSSSSELSCVKLETTKTFKWGKKLAIFPELIVQILAKRR